MRLRRTVTVAYWTAAALAVAATAWLVGRHARAIEVGGFAIAMAALAIPWLVHMLRPHPDLVLMATTPGYSTSNPRRNVNVRLTLENRGPGRAADWRVDIQSAKRPHIKVGHRDQTNATERPEGEGWRIVWQASAVDEIGVGLERELMLKTDDFDAGETVTATCLLRTARMKSRRIRLDISFPLNGEPEASLQRVS